MTSYQYQCNARGGSGGGDAVLPFNSIPSGYYLALKSKITDNKKTRQSWWETADGVADTILEIYPRFF